MKIVSFQRNADTTVRFGAFWAESGEILDFHSASFDFAPSQYLDWFDTAGAAHGAALAAERAAREDSARMERLRADGAIVARDDVQLCAPVPRPGKFICIGLNYRDHAEESGMEIPERPLVFSKFASCVVGPGASVELPPGSEQVDYEAELGVVIGRRARRVAKERALEHVLGYTNINDVSARDFQFADGQWQRGKSCETFAPSGPFVATTDEVPDPHSLRICFRLNGETLQDSNTDQLIFDVPSLVAALSEFITLEPGDMIATGTPPGVGFARKPPVYIGAGDSMEVEIEGLGVLQNPVIAPA